MKKITFFLLCLTIICSISQAQQKKIKQVAEAAEALRAAMIDPTKEKLESLVTDSLTYCHSGGHIDYKTEFVDKFISGKSDFVSIEITHQTIQVYKNTGILRHTLNAVTNDNGKPGIVKLDVMQVWIKQKGRWKLAARQAVKSR